MSNSASGRLKRARVTEGPGHAGVAAFQHRGQSANVLPSGSKSLADAGETPSLGCFSSGSIAPMPKEAVSMLPSAPGAGAPPRCGASATWAAPARNVGVDYAEYLLMRCEREREGEGHALREAEAHAVEDIEALQERERAKLLALELDDFRVFGKKSVSFGADRLTCVTGPNACGKSTIADATRFVLMRAGDYSASDLVRRDKPPCCVARVTAHFDTNHVGRAVLRREVRTDDRPSRCWVGTDAKGMREVSAQEYQQWLAKELGWVDGDLILPQFGLLGSRRAQCLLQLLPAALGQHADAGPTATGPLLKRRARAGASSQPSSACAGSGRYAEAWIARRLDEVYRELTREPLDEAMDEWGEGGQASLRRLELGSFALFVSERRGVAACGHGAALESLSDGDQDVCALALLLTLPGLLSSLQDQLPPFVLLDEPDSRLDKRHAKALRRFLSGPLGPKQCVLLSLNNHHAFDDGDEAVLRLPSLSPSTCIQDFAGEGGFESGGDW